MGFMGSCPIAGVIWQHIHYIVGLQRLGHEVYYIEDSARIPYNPETSDTSNDYTYAANLLERLAGEFGFEASLGVLRALSAGASDRRPAIKKDPSALSKRRRHPEHLRHSGIQRRSAGERSHSLRRERSRCGTDQGR